ncbi:MAG TPA: class I SAM-dependent methyltransferase, partial [Phycisphaerae bacterium]|nr:class I SAM-dependent methyltransferase [Phycisphaerae bacterium]
MTGTRSVRFTGLHPLALTLLALALLSAGPGAAAFGQGITDLTLKAEDLAALQARFADFSDDLPEAKKLGMDRITAYEENAQFVYAAGPVGSWTRRVVLLKPGVFVVDDLAGPGGGKAEWKNADKALRAELAGAGEKRYVHVFRLGDAKDAKIDAATDKKPLLLTVTQGQTKFELALPAEPDEAGTIATFSGDKAQLARRLLPSGIMPHGKTGIALLERWDKDYRRTNMPGWDAGRVASQLKKAVEEGKVKPGKALDLGCGTGTNAIYLAEKGFEVTGLEVAPTALTIAEAKARKAGVKVRWIVGDAANPPEMEPFDFIFDRGCYHHVRWVNRDGFVSAVSRLTKPGGQFLLLSFRAANER